MTTDLLISLAIIVALIFGYLFGKNRNKARMTKLASSNIDLIASIDSISKKSDERLELNHELLERHSKLKKDIELYEHQRSELIIRCSNIVENNNQLRQENEELRQTTDELLKDVDRYRGLSQQYEFQIQQFNIAKEPCKPTEQ